jgi:hypothetical protein
MYCHPQFYIPVPTDRMKFPRRPRGIAAIGTAGWAGFGLRRPAPEHHRLMWRVFTYILYHHQVEAARRYREECLRLREMADERERRKEKERKEREAARAAAAAAVDSTPVKAQKDSSAAAAEEKKKEGDEGREKAATL